MAERGSGRPAHRENLEIAANVATFVKNASVTARHRSFDYCFDHFQTARRAGEPRQLGSESNLELSCLHLGFYLASWGMYRGSGELLKQSLSALVPVVEIIAEAPVEMWDIDAGKYDGDSIEMLLDFAKKLRAAFPGRASDTLVTKTILGTLGAVPAFDQYFRRGFGVSTLNRKSLVAIDQFAKNHAGAIERARMRTIRFQTGTESEHQYTAAKVLDMAFFVEGGGRFT